ncbi:hypothetical protein FVEG_14916 [Fusarium verticillioides 7600]|uniref:Uncharacterized protein n=1 Tax=Gibberella moniliformis (strain M3125 / FGSC 7600) TaxID=334819 RepID=W7M0Y2_GIBM7|nr:hypothetical protein FVEG_14916 [Fusarium verticillioides 7600]EWG38562.1 hypothetical protein FVEG_14916 [Fusarium verticillioides 7600]
MPQLFEPKAGQETNFAFDKTPTYLFRLYDTKSTGFTNTDCVKSLAASKRSSDEFVLDPSCGTDLLQLPPKVAGTRLGYHLLKCKDREHNPCNLMSWSSSLLFLLQYGLHRTTPRSEINSELSEMKLIMIDTRNFPSQTFLRDIDAINCYRPYDRYIEKVRGWRMDDLYFGEYLSQGSLDIRGKCVQMTMQQLIDGGLLTVICPALDQKQNWSYWPTTVRALRKGIRNNDAVDARQIRTAISLGQVYGGDKFAIPLALMLLGLRSQPSDDELIFKTFSYLFTDEELDLGEIKYDVEAKRLLYGGTSVMEELKRFQELMEMINSFSHDIVEKKEQEDIVKTISDSFAKWTTNESSNAISSSRPRRFRRIFENA